MFAILALPAALLATPAEAAGFWETLFAAPARPALTPQMSGTPLHMTVRPKRKKLPANGDGAKPLAAKEGPATPLVKPMNIAGDPFWYLKDTTLKKGDIIVLENRVVVFDGGARAYANFDSFQTSRLLSEKARRQLRYLVSAPKDRSTVWEPVKAIADRNAAAELPERMR
jgi:hypothetical protein